MSLSAVLITLAILIPQSFDTFILAAALGLAGLPKKQRLRTSLILAAFEAGMPLIGVLIGFGIGQVLGDFAGYIGAIVIGIAGFLMLRSDDDEEDEAEQRLKLLSRVRGFAIISLGLSTSLDEMAAGVGLGLLQLPLVFAVIFLGVQAFIASQLGLWVGGKLSEVLRERAEKVAGLMLIGTAVLLLVLKVTGNSL